MATCKTYCHCERSSLLMLAFSTVQPHKVTHSDVFLKWFLMLPCLLWWLVACLVAATETKRGKRMGREGRDGGETDFLQHKKCLRNLPPTLPALNRSNWIDYASAVGGRILCSGTQVDSQYSCCQWHTTCLTLCICWLWNKMPLGDI